MAYKSPLIDLLIDVNVQESAKTLLPKLEQIGKMAGNIEVETSLKMTGAADKGRQLVKEMIPDGITITDINIDKGISKKLKDEITSTMGSLSGTGAVLKDVFRDAETGILKVVGQVSSLGGQVKTIKFNFDEATGAVEKYSEKISYNVEQQIEATRKRINSLQAEYGRITAAEGTKREPVDAEERKLALVKQINTLYGEQATIIAQSSIAGKEVRDSMLGQVSAAKQATDQFIKLADAKAAQAKKDFDFKQEEDNVKRLSTEIEQLTNKIVTMSGRFQKEDLYGNTNRAEAHRQSLINLQEEFDELQKKVEETGMSAKSFNKLEEKIESSKKVIEELGTTADIQAKNLEQLDDRFGKIMSNTPGKDFFQMFKKYETTGAQKDLDALGQALSGVSGGYVTLVSDASAFSQATAVVRHKVEDADGVVRTHKYTLDKLQEGFRDSGTEMDKAGANVKSWASSIKDAAENIIKFQVGREIVFGVVTAFKEGVQAVEEMDTQLTQIAVVTGTTREQVAHLKDEYANTAIEMGKTVSEISEMNAELVRQGLSLEEAAERADTIVKLSAAGAITTAQSLEVITAGVNAMGESHEKVADVLLKAANITASDVEGLGEAFTKTASGAAAAGMSIEETTALLSTMKDVTQESDSSLGTSLKSILARFSKIDEATGETNKDLNTVQTAIESVGVAFTDMDGQIRPVYDVLADLSEIWDDLDRNTQAYIATQAAGTRQQNRFYAIMDNFNMVQATHNDLLESGGSLQQAYAVYMSSSEAAGNRLKASIEKLWLNFIDSDVLIFLKNVASGILEWVDGVGVLDVALAGFLAKLTLLNKTFMKETLTNVIDKVFGSNVSGAVDAVSDSLDNVTSKAGIAEKGVAGFLNGGSILGKLAKGGLVVLAIGAVSWAVSKVIEKMQEAEKVAKEIEQRNKDKYNSAIAEVSKQNVNHQEVKNLGEEYIELKNKINLLGSEYKLTKEDAQRWYEVQREIAEVVPNVSYRTDEQGRVILNGVSSVEKLTKSYQDYLDVQTKIAAQGASTVFKEEYDAAIKQATESRQQLDKIEQEIKDKQRDFNLMRGQLQRTVTEEENWSIRERMAVRYEEIDSLKEQRDAILEITRKNDQLILDSLNKTGMQKLKLQEEFRTLPASLQAVVQQNPILLSLDLDRGDLDLAKQKLVEFTEAFQQSSATLKLELFDGTETVKIQEAANMIGVWRQALAEGEISAQDFMYNQQALIDALEALPFESGSVMDMWRDSLILMAQESSLTNEEIRADTELTTAQIEESAKRRAEAMSNAHENYVTAGKSISDYLDLLDMLNDANLTDLEIQAYILDNHPEFIGMMGDRISLTGAVQDGILSMAETQLNSYVDMLIAGKDFNESVAGGAKDLLRYLIETYAKDGKSFTFDQKEKARIMDEYVNHMAKSYSGFLEWQDGQLRVSINNFNKFAAHLQKDTTIMDDFAPDRGFGAKKTYLTEKLERLKNFAKEQNAIIGEVWAKFDGQTIQLPDFSNMQKKVREIQAQRKKAEEARKKAEAEAKKRKKEAEAKAKKAAAEAKKAAAAAKRAREKKKREAEAKAKKAAAEAKKAQKAKEAAAKKAQKEKEAAAKKAAAAKKKALEEEKKAQKELLKLENERIKAHNDYMKMVQDSTKEVFDFAIKYIKYIEETKRENAKKIYEDEKKQIEDTAEKQLDALEKEKDKRLEVLDAQQKTRDAEEAALEYLKQRREIQTSIVKLEYQLALTSLDSSTQGISRRKTLEESLAEERKRLAELQANREKTLQQEAYAAQRTMIENQYQVERAYIEANKQQTLARIEAEYQAKLAALDKEYTDFRNYAKAKEAVQTGMIRNLNGEMIPLVKAFEELAKHNGEFWTFFGQKEVDDFGKKVKNVISYVKDLGFKTIQVWEAVAEKIADAVDAAEKASRSTSKVSKPSSSKTSTVKKTTSTKSTSTKKTSTKKTTKTPAKTAKTPSRTNTSTKTTVKTDPTKSAARIKELQRFINRAAGYSKTDVITPVAVDGKFGSVTQSRTARIAYAFFAPGKSKANATMYDMLTRAATRREISKALYDRLDNYSFPPKKDTSGSKAPTRSTAKSGGAGADPRNRNIKYSMYNKGGKIKHTGLAMVHGSKTKPEYVYNYEQFKDLAKMISRQQFLDRSTVPAMVPQQEVKIEIQNLVNIEGNADKSCVNDIKIAAQSTAKELAKTIRGKGRF